MKFGRLALAAAASLGFAASAFAGNGSNFQQQMNGVDFFYGGFLNPLAPTGTMGAFRCIPSDILHAPTMVVDPVWAGFTQGTYAAKVCALHFVACASTGITAVWPNITLSSSDGDCRFAPGAVLNYGFASSTPIIGPGLGWMGVGPLNGSTPGAVNLLAVIGNVQFGGPFQLGTVATIYGLNLNLTQLFGSPSTITVPGGESLTYWIAEDLVQGPADYQYWVASNDERNICSSVSFLASAIGTPNGAVYGLPTTFEFGMFIATEDATLMAAVAPGAFGVGGAETTMGGANPMDTGTGGRTLSLTGVDPTGGNGLGFEILSFNSYDEGNPFGGSGKLLFVNLRSVNALAAPSCGPWSAGYFGLPTGGPGGPVLSTLIPQNPRIVGQLDVVALNLIGNPVWTLSTIHNTIPGGNQYPMFGNIPSLIGGSTGNNGGFGIPVPNLAALVGIELFFSGVNLNASNSAIAKTANNGTSHQNGFSTFIFP